MRHVGRPPWPTPKATASSMPHSSLSFAMSLWAVVGWLVSGVHRSKAAQARLPGAPPVATTGCRCFDKQDQLGHELHRKRSARSRPLQAYTPSGKRVGSVSLSSSTALSREVRDRALLGGGAPGAALGPLSPCARHALAAWRVVAAARLNWRAETPRLAPVHAERKAAGRPLNVPCTRPRPLLQHSWGCSRPPGPPAQLILDLLAERR
jgi:hypothetical protein